MEDWLVDQYRFQDAYRSRRGGAERRRVKLLWWTETRGRGPDVTGVMARLFSSRAARLGDGELVVALYAASAPVGARPFLVVRTVPGALVEPRGRGTGIVVGRAEPRGALAIETSRGTVMPGAPPAAPDDDAPAWSELDPPDK